MIIRWNLIFTLNYIEILIISEIPIGILREFKLVLKYIEFLV